MTLEEMKNFLRVDHDFDDKFIELTMKSSMKYVKNAITSEENNSFFEDNELYDLAVFMLTGHWYEKKVAAVEKPLSEIPFGVISIIQQLRGMYSNGF